MSMLSNALGGGGSSIPTLDTNKLNAINQANAQKQRDLITQKFQGLQPVNQQYQTQREQLSAGVLPGAEKNIAQYGESLGGVNAADAAARQQSTDAFRAQSFRDVPAMQQAIRNSLGGSHLMGSGAATSTLAKPLVNAAQNASDVAAQNEQARLTGVTNRAQGLADTSFSARQNATAQRLGIDQGTIDMLTQMGRTDLIDKFNGLSGVEDQSGANALGIEEAGQQSAIAKAQADAQKKSGVLGSLGSLAGLGIGAFGGPVGMAIGSQLGGTLGTLAGGGTPQQIDPTLLYAMAQRNKNSVSRSLGGGNSTPTVNNYSSFQG